MKTNTYWILIAFILGVFMRCSDNKIPDEEQQIKDNPGETGLDYDTLMSDLYTLIEADFDSVATIIPFQIPDFYYNIADTDTSIQNTLEEFELINRLSENPQDFLNAGLKSAPGENWKCVNKEENNLFCEYTYICDKGNYKFKSVYTNYYFDIIIEDFYITGTIDGIVYGDMEEDEYYLMFERSNQFGNLNFTELYYFAPYSEDARGKEWMTRVFQQGETIIVDSWWTGKRIITEHELITTQFSMAGEHHAVLMTVDYWKGGLWELTTSWHCINYKTLRPSSILKYNFNEHEGSYCSYDCDGIPLNCKDL